MMDPNAKQAEKIYISLRDQKKVLKINSKDNFLVFLLQHNLLGRLLGPKGMTLKSIQAETQTKMSILGRGSIKDRNREEELRNSNDPAYGHLNDDLHILIEGSPPYAHIKLSAGVAEVKKMLIPLVRRGKGEEKVCGGPMSPISKFLSFN